MAQQPIQAVKVPPPTDPYEVKEMFVNGPMNCHITGPVAQLTFTHVRPEIADLFANKNPPKIDVVVMARIVLPVEQLAELRAMLNRLIKDASPPASGASH
ncbi:MAG: hypothetical protein HY269_01725 [Deltaproteobacteria bacterium]|nr:hypothetical protein [Deltaproteobacteria bacterium]